MTTLLMLIKIKKTKPKAKPNSNDNGDDYDDYDDGGDDSDDNYIDDNCDDYADDNIYFPALSIYVCTDLTSKELHSHVGVGLGVISGKPMSCNGLAHCPGMPEMWIQLFHHRRI